MSLITNLDVRAYMNDASTDATYNTELSRLCGVAESEIQKFLNWDYEPSKTRVFTFEGCNNNRIRIPYPVSEYTTLTRRKHFWNTVENLSVSPLEIFYDEFGQPTICEIDQTGPYHYFESNYQYTLKYKTAALDTDKRGAYSSSQMGHSEAIKQIAIEWVAEAWREGGFGTMSLGHSSDLNSLSQRTSVALYDLKPRFLAMLKPYRHIPG